MDQADFAKAVPFDELLPKLRKGRGPNKAPTKKQVTLRLSLLSSSISRQRAKGGRARSTRPW